MHPQTPARRACGLFLTLTLGMVLGSTLAPALAQTSGHPGEPVPDPLEFLKPGEPPTPGEIRLHLTLLRVPTVDFARALAQDSEAGGHSWHRWLLQAKAGKKLERVDALTVEARPGERFKEGFRRPFHFIRQKAASHLWAQIQQMPAPEMNTELWDELVEGLAEEPVGTLATGQVALAPRHGGAEIALAYAHMPSPDKRPSPTWVHPLFPTPKVFFRPWRAHSQTLVPLREPFLIASQMEPPRDGQADADSVWALFGRLTLAPDLASRELEGTPLESTGGALQTWTVEVPVTTFQPWMLTRKSAEFDGRTLGQWLARADAKGGTKVLATSSVAASPGKTTLPSAEEGLLVDSALQWLDPTGFEPAHNDRVFRPCVAEDGDYALRHELKVSLKTRFPEAGFPATQVDAYLEMREPPSPVRWKRWKHAMEGTENDEGNLELAEVNFLDHEGHTLETSLSLKPGRVVLTRAALRQGRVQATFTRMTDGTLPAQSAVTSAGARAPEEAPSGEGDPADAKPSITMTTWHIDTPLDWTGRMLAAGPAQSGLMATALLEALQSGKTKLAALTVSTQKSDNHSDWNHTEPVTFYGGEYLNTAPHAKGIYFNMRNVELKMVGGKEGLDVSAAPEASLVQVNMEIEHSGPPVWRHWGIWQPGVSGTNASNSGVNRPSFQVSVLHSQANLPWLRPVVVSVAPVADPSAPGGAPTALRWCVICATPDESSSVRLLPALADAAPHRSSVFQVVVLALPKSVAIPSDSQNLAEELLAEVAVGKRPVLDAAAIFKLGTSPSYATLRCGTEYHFTNGRVHPHTEDEAPLINAPAVMPPDTKYEDQIALDHRIVGMDLTASDERWTLIRDHHPPDVVTDTFHKVLYEFPLKDHDDPKRTSVSVQRPIFHVTKVEGDLPVAGRPVVVRMSDETVVVVQLHQ
jgi:hypothetical protein